MAFVLTLPDSILTELLSKWLVLEELRTVDYALCSKQSRTNFLSIISGPHFVIPHCPDDPTFKFYHYYFEFDNFEDFLVDRKIKLQYLLLEDNNFKNGKLKCPVDCSKVTHLYLSNFADFYGMADVKEYLTEDQIVDFIHSFPDLCSLKVAKAENFIADTMSKVSGSTLAKLTALDICGSMDGPNDSDCISAHTLEHLKEHCIDLKTLKLPQTRFDDGDSLDGNSLNAHERALVAFVLSLNNLEHFSADIWDNRTGPALLGALADSCPKLKTVELPLSASFNGWSSVAKVFRQCPDLNKFETLVEQGGFMYHRGSSNNKRSGLHICMGELHEQISESDLCTVLEAALPHVESLSMSHVDALTKRALEMMTKHGTKLKILEVLQSGDADETLTIADTWRNVICRSDSKLENVTLCDMPEMSNEFLLHVFASPLASPLPTPVASSVTSLQLKHLPELDTDTVIKIIEANPQLKSFTYGRCSDDRFHVDGQRVREHVKQSEGRLSVVFVDKNYGVL